MDELENQTIRQWRDSEKSVTTLKSTLVQIDPGQRYRIFKPHLSSQGFFLFFNI